MEINVVELMDVLKQGNRHIVELESHLAEPFSASPEACKLLLSQVQSALATAIAMTNYLEQGKSQFLLRATDSPGSDCSEKTFREQERRERCKKRKTLQRWSMQLRACSGSAMDFPVDDGHSWRKYGQKDILGAKFPRGYYRCTYRNSHGCVATRQVQRSDDDPFVFDITYRGAHTCSHGLQNSPLLSPKGQSFQQYKAPKEEQQQQQQQQQLHIFRTGLKVKTEGLNSDNRQLEYSPSFSFPSMPESCLNLENGMLSCASMPENYMSCDSEISDVFSAATSTTSSPMVGMDFGWEQLFFDSEIPFDFC